MKVTLIPVTPFQQNSSLLVCEATGRAAVVDPGGDLDVIQGEIARQNVTVEKVFLTHGHIDHCAGAKTLATHYGVPIEGPHPDESFWLDKLPDQSTRFGFPAAEAFEPDRWLQDGETVQFGNEILEVYHCPGHTPGHVVFFSRAHRLALVGDVLFAGSIGRTDFPRGNHADLIRAIREKLWPLGDDVTFVPGHGPTSTFGAERRTNPFASAAYTEDKQLIATFSANLELLEGATPHPVQEAWWKTQPEAWEACRKDLQDPQAALTAYVEWVEALPGKPVFVAMPAGFDFTYMFWYMMRFVGRCPFSWSALDIKTLAFALTGLPYRKNIKPRFPKHWFDEHPHTHVALDDAIEQGALFCNMLKDLRAIQAAMPAASQEGDGTGQNPAEEPAN
ncbi:hypothetical protein KCU90_g4164, partial [Aureobasidium melanogenum]